MKISEVLGIFSVVITEASMVQGSAMVSMTLLREVFIVSFIMCSFVVTKTMMMMRNSSIIFIKIGRKYIIAPWH